jgi:hypothetical protein
MASLFETVQEFFAAEGWATERSDDTTLRMSFRGDNATWTCFARVREAHGQVVFYSVAPGSAPAALRPAVAELIARANVGLVVGNFELDFRDGEIRFRTSLELGPDGLEDVPFARLFGRLVGTNLRMMDRYLPGLLDVLGERAPAEALAAIDAAGA